MGDRRTLWKGCHLRQSKTVAISFITVPLSSVNVNRQIKCKWLICHPAVLKSEVSEFHGIHVHEE